jgi:NAD(P)-dependent dehydrogenase (short-subunit alcohol dehydrogenase family)
MSKHYVIVGGTSGIGRALLDLLLERGHRITQISRHPEVVAGPSGIASIPWDVRSQSFPSDLLPTALDGLVYCPGTIRLAPFERIADTDWLEDLEINLLGAVRALRGSIKALKSAENASVVLFSTVAASTGLPFHASIAAAKGAVEGLTRSLAAELAPRIRVNAVAPTLTATPLAERLIGSPAKRDAAADRHPLKTIGDPAVVARAALWLLEDALLTTGQIIRVDAGFGDLRTT